jgi:uncharacterized protein
MLMSDPDRPEVVISVFEARGAAQRMRGLIGSEEVGRGQGLLLKVKQVHTIGMAYSIDTVYLSRKGRVLRVRTMQPGRVGPFILAARWVLELDSGEAARLGIKEGGTLIGSSW